MDKSSMNKSSMDKSSMDKRNGLVKISRRISRNTTIAMLDELS